MNGYKKYWLLLGFLGFAICNAHANAIDSLTDKESIKRFLAEKLSKSGVICSDECAEIAWGEKVKLDLFKYPPKMDTVLNKNSKTGLTETKAVARDNNLHLTDQDTETDNYAFDKVAEMIENIPWHIEKEDVDDNGKTDLIIVANIVLIVMDMGDHFEAHLFSERPYYNWHSYSFKTFKMLPDGTCALLLRHDHNPCKSGQHSYLNGDVTYVTTITADKTGSTSSSKIDTLYKIKSGNDTGRPPSYASDQSKIIINKYVDTMDVQLYNNTDTVVYKFGGFTYYKPRSKPVGISKIDYQYRLVLHAISSMKQGISYLEINKNGKCFLQYNDYDQCFSSTLDSVRLQDLLNFTSYIDVKTKKDFYWCESLFGGSGGVFTIHFDDGTVKNIDVWSHELPMDLGYLSKILSDISRDLKWAPSDKPTGFEFPSPMFPSSSPGQAEMDNNLIECKCY